MRILTFAAVAALGLAFLTPAARAGDPYYPHHHGSMGRGYPTPAYTPSYYGRGPDRFASPYDRFDHGCGYNPGPAFYPPSRPVVVVPPPARPVIVVPPPRPPVCVPAPQPVPFPRSGFSFSLNILR